MSLNRDCIVLFQFIGIFRPSLTWFRMKYLNKSSLKRSYSHWNEIQSIILFGKIKPCTKIINKLKGTMSRCTYKHLSLFSLIKRWVLNWGTLTCELFTDPAGLSSSFKRASSRNNHNRHVELSEVTGIVGIPNSEMKNTHSASC